MTCCWAFKSIDHYPLSASKANRTAVRPRLSRFMIAVTVHVSSVAGAVSVVVVRSISRTAVVVRTVPVAWVMVRSVPGA